MAAGGRAAAGRPRAGAAAGHRRRDVLLLLQQRMAESTVLSNGVGDEEPVSGLRWSAPSRPWRMHCRDAVSDMARRYARL